MTSREKMRLGFFRFVRKNPLFTILLALAAGVMIEGARQDKEEVMDVQAEAVETEDRQARNADKIQWINLRNYISQLILNTRPALALVGNRGTTGIFVEPDLILTSGEALDAKGSIRVDLEKGTQVEGQILGVDPLLNLALIKVEAEVSPATIYSNGTTAGPSWVFTMGLNESGEPAVSPGLVSHLGEENSTLNLLSRQNLGLQPPPGVHGAAVLNIDGHLVGFLPAASNGHGIWGKNLESALQQLKARGKVRRPWIGLTVASLDPAVLARLKLESGLLVSEAFPQSPASRAGVRAGDILLTINGAAVATPNEYRRILLLHPEGVPCELKFRRGRRVFTRKAQVLERSARLRLEAGGTWVESLSASVKRETVRPGAGQVSVSGLRVTFLTPGKQAFVAGIRAGDVILSVNQRRLYSASQLRLRYERATEPLLVKLLRGEKQHLMMLPPFQPPNLPTAKSQTAKLNPSNPKPGEKR